MVLIISCSENQQEAGGYSSPASGDPSCRPESPGRPFFHKDRITDLLPYLVVEIGCFEKTSLLVKKNGITGVAFHNNITHFSVTPFITCFKCPLMISYPFV